MTDFDNRETTGAPEEAAPAETVSNEAPAPASEPVQEADTQQSEAQKLETQQPAHETAPTPHLTLEPDPVPPEIPEKEPDIPGSSADAFHMPEPPHAPEPPRQEPAYQQTPPDYSQPQYGVPQYGAPQYQQNPYGAPQPYYGKPLYNVPPAGYVQKSRLAAGLLAIAFGAFGVHNFYLGFNSRAIVQLVVSLVGIILCLVFIGFLAILGMYIWAFVEGVLLLSGAPSRMYDGNGVITKD